MLVQQTHDRGIVHVSHVAETQVLRHDDGRLILRPIIGLQHFKIISFHVDIEKVDGLPRREIAVEYLGQRHGLDLAFPDDLVRSTFIPAQRHFPGKSVQRRFIELMISQRLVAVGDRRLDIKVPVTRPLFRARVVLVQGHLF
jgi:hypothetical protein